MRLIDTISVPTILAVSLLAPGCGREGRGPALLGGRDVRSWVADLHHPQAQVRRRAVLKLGNVGDADPAVAAGLIEAMDDRDPLVRRDAIVAVTRLKDPGPTVWEHLDRMTRSDKDARVRELAHQAIVRRRDGG